MPADPNVVTISPALRFQQRDDGVLLTLTVNGKVNGHYMLYVADPSGLRVEKAKVTTIAQSGKRTRELVVVTTGDD